MCLIDNPLVVGVGDVALEDGRVHTETRRVRVQATRDAPDRVDLIVLVLDAELEL